MGKRQSTADLLKVPAYTIAEAASYLAIPASTVRSWVQGRDYQVQGPKTKRFQPVILAAAPADKLLSFENLIELYVLGALRREHHVALSGIRSAVARLRKETRDDHPLASNDLFTDRRSLFVKRWGTLVNISEDGQTAMEEVLGRYLERVERTPKKLPIRLFPLTRDEIEESPSQVAIDPRYRFGRPFIIDCGVETSIIAERFRAGDSVKHLKKEYGTSGEAIEEALRYEQRRAA